MADSWGWGVRFLQCCRHWNVSQVPIDTPYPLVHASNPKLKIPQTKQERKTGGELENWRDWALWEESDWGVGEEWPRSIMYMHEIAKKTKIRKNGYLEKTNSWVLGNRASWYTSLSICHIIRQSCPGTYSVCRQDSNDFQFWVVLQC